MAFTKVLGPGIHTQANILSHNINSSGIITATKFVGPITGGGGDFNAGIVTCTTLDVNGNGDISGNLVLGGNLTVNGTTTTLDTNLIGVDRVEVTTAGTNVAVAVTHNGTGDLVRLYDGTSQKVTVDDEGKVGIGTDNPDHKLHVLQNAGDAVVTIESTGNGNDAALEFIRTSSGGDSKGGASIYVTGDTSASEARMHFGVGHNISHGQLPRMTIMGNGEVGIGTIAPGKTLDIWNTTANADLRLKTTANSFNSLIFDSARVKDTQFAIIDGRWNGNDVARIQFVTGSDDTNYDDGFMAFHTRESGETLSERLRIDSTGKIGIGTVNPARKVHIHEDGSIANYLSFTNTTTGVTASSGFHIGIDASENAILNNYGNKNIEILCNGSERVRITSAGRVGIGTVTPTRGPLHVHENSNSDVQIHLTNSETGPTSTDGLTIFAGGDAGPVAGFVNRESGGDFEFYTHNGSSVGERVRITSAGNVKVPDNAKIELGGAQTGAGDLSIYHDTSDSWVKTTTGDLWLQSTADDVIVRAADNISLQVQGGEYGIDIAGNAAVKLFYDASVHTTAKLETTATGITVDGEVASSQDYPSIRPTLDFNFAAVKKLDPRITYRRTGPASYTDELGYLKLVGDNIPRFDHDPYTRESKGLLIEESRINLMKSNTYPHVAKSTYNSNSNGAIVEVSDDVLAPDGSAHTLKLHWTNYTATHNGYVRVGNQTEIGTLAAATYGFSFFVKRGTDGNHNMEEFLAGTATGIGDAQHHFTIQEFSPASASNVKICNNSDVTIDKYPDGWYRLSGTITTSGSSNPDNTGASYYVLASTPFKTFFEAMPFYHWGFQLEVGACPSSYIGGTVSATTTRGWEVPIITGTDLTDVFNPTEGTMFYEASVSSLTNDNQPIVAFRDLGTTSDNYHAMGYRIGGGSSGNIRTWFKSNNSNTYLSNHGSTGMVAGSPYKHMYGYKLNDATDAYSTGAASAQITDSSVTPMLTSGVVDELRFGGYYSGPETTTYSLEAGHIKRFSYWNTKLSNTQIKTYVS